MQLLVQTLVVYHRKANIAFYVLLSCMAKRRAKASRVIGKAVKSWIKRRMKKAPSLPLMCPKPTIAVRKYSHLSSNSLVKMKKNWVPDEKVIIKCEKERNIIRRLDSVPQKYFSVWKHIMK